MTEDFERDPLTLPVDVGLGLVGTKWKLKSESQNEVKKRPRDYFVIEADEPLRDDHWSVWFDPSTLPHKPKNRRVAIRIHSDVAHATDEDLREAKKQKVHLEKTKYKYTIRVKWGGEVQIIDPKIIIDPPT